MHILYIGWAFHVHLRRWAGYFAHKGHRVTILSPASHAQPLAKARVIKLFLSEKRYTFSEAEVLLWSRLLRPDVCHVHWAGFSPLTRKIKTCPVGITAWGSDVYRLNEEQFKVRERTIDALRAAKFVTCDSLDQKKCLRDLMGFDHHISVIQWGVDINQFKPGINTRDWRERLGISQETKVIFSPRGTPPIYESETIIEAFALLVTKYKNVVLIHKSYNPDEQRLHVLRELVSQKGLTDRVIWVGKIPYEEMPALYNLSDIMVSVPRIDGTAMSLLEAMACGVAPVVSRLPSTLEWVQDGVNGRVVPVRNPQILSQAMLDLLQDDLLRTHIVKHNLKLVSERASQDKNMAKMAELYKRVINSTQVVPI